MKAIFTRSAAFLLCVLLTVCVFAVVANAEAITSQEAFIAAVEAAEDGATIELGEIEGKYKLPNIPKNITVKAAEDAAVVFDCDGKAETSICSISSVTFEGCTFDFGPQKNYRGFHGSQSLTFKGCTFKGEFWTYANNFICEDCEFVPTTHYALYVYGSVNIKLTRCVFTGNDVGKAVKVAQDGRSTHVTVIADDCDFTCTKANKCAFMLDSQYSPITVIANNCTFDDNFKGNVESCRAGDEFYYCWDEVAFTHAGKDNVFPAACAVGDNIVLDEDNKIVSGELIEYYAHENKDGDAPEALLSEDSKLTDNGNGTWTVEAAASGVAKIGTETYDTLAAAISAAKDGDEIILTADLADIGTVSLSKNITLNGDGHKITGTSAIYFAPTMTATVKNVVFENIHNNTVVNDDTYGYVNKIGNQSAIYAGNLTTGNITVTGCTFDNIDWDAIQIVPYTDSSATVTITNNIFKHTDTESIQLRYVHIQHTETVYPQYIHLTITDNQFLDTDKSADGEKITSVGLWKINPYYVNVAGNYFDDVETISGGNIPASAFYPMRSVADVDVDDKTLGVATIGTTSYTSLADAIKAYNAMSASAELKLTADIVVNKTIEVNNPGKTLTVNCCGFDVIANTAIFKVSSQVNFRGDNGMGGKYGLITCPADGNLFEINGGTLNINNGVFSSDCIEQYVLTTRNFAKQNADGNYELAAISSNLNEAIARGYVAGTSLTGSGYFYKSLSELFAAGKNPALFLTDVNEDVTVLGKYMTLAAETHTFTGAVTNDNAVNGVIARSGQINFTSLNAEKLALGYGKTTPAYVTIAGGNLKTLVFNCDDSTLVITGGTFGFDPTPYVPAEGYTVTDNGDGTWTVTKTAADIVDKTETVVTDEEGNEVEETVIETIENAIEEIAAEQQENIVVEVNDAQTAEIKEAAGIEDPESVTTGIEVALKEMVVKNEKPTSLTYDVEAFATVTKGTETKKIKLENGHFEKATIRLAAPGFTAGEYAKVKHIKGEKNVDTYSVKVQGELGKEFVEVAVDHFSTFVIEGDENTTKNAYIINMPKADDTHYRVEMLAGIDSLKYSKVGFEIKFDDNGTERYADVSSSTVYTSVVAKQNGELKEFGTAAFGEGCNYIISITAKFNVRFDNTPVTFRPYKVSLDGSTVEYGHWTTIADIYTAE